MRFRSGIDHWHLPEESFREKRLVFADAEKPDYEKMTPEERAEKLKSMIPPPASPLAKKEVRNTKKPTSAEQRELQEAQANTDYTILLRKLYNIDPAKSVHSYDPQEALKKGLSVEDWFDEHGELKREVINNEEFAGFLDSFLHAADSSDTEQKKKFDSAIEAIKQGTAKGKELADDIRLMILQTPAKHKENNYTLAFGINIEEAAAAYMKKREVFSKKGLEAPRWLDENGKLMVDQNALKNELEGILVFPQNQGVYSNKSEQFYNDLADSQSDAIRILRILQGSIEQREILDPHGTETMMNARLEELGVNPSDPVEKTIEVIGDMLRYGDPIEQAQAAGVIAAVAYFGLFGKGMLGKATRIGAMAYAAHGVALHFGVNVPKELGLIADNLTIKGTPADALYKNIDARYQDDLERKKLDEWEQRILTRDDEKTSAIIALSQTPLEQLLDWHQNYIAQKDTDGKRNVLLNQIPSQARFWGKGVDPFDASSLVMGALSLYLKEAAHQYSDANPGVIKTPIEGVLARKIVRAKYYGDLENDTEPYTTISKQYANMPYRQVTSTDPFVFADFMSYEADSSGIKESKEDPTNIAEEIYDRTKEATENLLKKEHMLQLAQELGIQKDKAIAMFEKWGADGIQKTDKLVRDVLDIPDDKATIDFINGKITLTYNKYGKEHVTTLNKVAGGIWEVSWGAFTFPFEALYIMGKSGYEAYEILKQQDLMGKIEGGADTALLWLQEKMGYGLEQTQAAKLGDYLQSNEAYSASQLGQFANEYVGLNAGELNEIDLTSELGGKAIFAFERIDLETIAPPSITPGRRLSESEWKLHVHEKLLEQAKVTMEKKLEEDARYKGKGIVFDPNKDVVGAVFSNKEGKSGFATIFLRMPLTKPLEPDQVAPATEIKTFDWVLEQYLEKWRHDKLFIENALKDSEGKTIYEDKSTPSVAEFIDRMESAIGHEKNLSDLQNGIKQIIHNTPESRKQSYLKDTNEIRKSLKELITKNFKVIFAEDVKPKTP